MSASRDVAERAGVSPAVVSRVYNADPTLRISEETRERVLEAIADLNYVPRRAARALRMNLQSGVTLVTPDPTSAVYAELIRGVEHAALGNDLQVVVASPAAAGQPGWLTRMVDEGRTDGVMIQPAPDMSEEQHRELLGLRVPVVSIFSNDPRWPFPSVRLDDVDGVRCAIDHLVESGHRDIGYLGGVPGFGSADRRKEGFVAGLRAHGLQPRSAWMTESGYVHTDGREAIRTIWARDSRPSAVVIANVNAALGALAELHSLGADLPRDLSVVALHDVWYADAVWPPLTTVKLPMFEVGVAATRRLFMNGGPMETVVAEPGAQLISRSSVWRI